MSITCCLFDEIELDFANTPITHIIMDLSSPIDLYEYLGLKIKCLHPCKTPSKGREPRGLEITYTVLKLITTTNKSNEHKTQKLNEKQRKWECQSQNFI